MNKDVQRILIAGEGGQGVQRIAHAFTHAAFNTGFHVLYLPNYGVEQRGGVSLGFLQYGKGEIGFPKFSTADIMVVLCSRAVERTRQYVSDDTIYIYDNELIKSSEIADISAQKIAVSATKIANEKLTPKAFNMILAGALLSETEELTIKSLEEALEIDFKDKYKEKPQLRSFNKRALELGYKLAKNAYK
jgi:2-oxoglutarate ferredoxin oxidoreductase subunit gamma